MKRVNALTFNVVATSLAIGTVSCDNAERVAAPDTDPLVLEIIAMGFRPDMIAAEHDYFVVEGDIRIAKSDLLGSQRQRQFRQKGPPVQYQYVTDTLVSYYGVSDIGVFIDASVNTAWKNATLQAIEQWNAIPGTNIRFVASSPYVDLVVSASVIDQPSRIIAQASWPGRGFAPGNTITIDSYDANWGSASQKLFVMAHELGHTIGFRHTNWQQVDNCGLGTCDIGANLVAGTPPTDGSSVMNGNTAGNSWSGFSAYDRLAASTIYPAPPTPIVTDVATTRSPAKQYLPFTITIGGSGFDPSGIEVVLRGSSMSGCYNPCIITNISEKTSTRVVASAAFSIAANYDVTVRNGPKGRESQAVQITVAPMY